MGTRGGIYVQCLLVPMGISIKEDKSQLQLDYGQVAQKAKERLSHCVVSQSVGNTVGGIVMYRVPPVL